MDVVSLERGLESHNSGVHKEGSVLFQCLGPLCYRLFTTKRGLSLHQYYAGHKSINEPPTTFEYTPEQVEITEQLERVLSDKRLRGSRDESAMSLVLGDRDMTASLASVYFLEDLALDYSHLKPLAAELTAQTMRQALDYLVMSSLGEARHIADRPQLVDERRLYWLSQWFVTYLRRIRGSYTRGSIWFLAHEAAQVVGYEAVLSVAQDIHKLTTWRGKGGFGGPKWAAVAQLGLDFVQGTKSPLLALDSIVDVVHNGGWAFNKYYSQRHICSYHTTALKRVLDAKATNARVLLRMVCLPTQVKNALTSGALVYRVAASLPTIETNTMKNHEVVARRTIGLSIDINEEAQTDPTLWPNDADGFMSWANATKYKVEQQSYDTWRIYYGETGHPPSYKELYGWLDWTRPLPYDSWAPRMVEALSAGHDAETAIRLFNERLATEALHETISEQDPVDGGANPSQGSEGGTVQVLPQGEDPDD